MINLSVYVEQNGKSISVGTISGTDTESAVFRYADSYLEDASHTPLSVSLPLQKEAFSPARTRCFFDALLPEGFTRRSLAERLQTDVNDYCRLLAVVGRECIGAVRITPSSASVTDTESYEKVKKRDLVNLATKDAAVPAEWMNETRLSLAGATGKTGLYYDAGSKQWFLPKGNAPSTHIVKQRHVRFSGIVTNEQLCMRTAAYLGLPTATSFLYAPVKNDPEHALYVTARFDRKIPDNPETVSGLPRPLRLHQEDFGQALGVPPEKKYEPDSGDYLRRMFELLRLQSLNPLEDQMRLWEMIVFQCLIGNADAHLKNYSLLYDESLKGKRLAPAYDILSTFLYRESTRQAAMRIGDVTDLDVINRNALILAAREVHIGTENADAVITRLSKQFEPAIKRAAAEQTEAGFPDAAGFAKRLIRRKRRLFPDA